MYDKIAKGYDELHKEEQIKKLIIIEDNLTIRPEFRLLDIGAGTGISTNFFECNAIGIEPSENMIKHSAGDKELVQGFAEKLPFKDKYFDIIISVSAIHNFDNPEKAIKEMIRVSKMKCQFAITLLKKSQNYKKIQSLLLKYFSFVKVIDEDKDTIFIMENK
jgi:ubiquinone/menaquinone biosynthesis C-methylase UbiE